MGESEEGQFHYLGLATYAMLAFVFATYVLLSQSGYSKQSDLLILGLGILLISYTLLLGIVGSGLVESFELSAIGFKAKFFRGLREYQRSTEGRVSRRGKAEIEFAWNEYDSAARFLRLIGEIEQALRDLAVRNDVSVQENATLASIIHRLEMEGAVPRPLAHAALEYANIRNQLVHGKVKLSERNIQEALSIGLRILSDLRDITKSGEN